LILEPEFAQVLKVLARERNTLSPVVRNAWNGKPLQTITRNAPIRAREAHLSIIGHITKDELLRFINGTELANGFFNRFLVIAVQRSQELPFGGRLAGDALDHVRNQAHVRNTDPRRSPFARMGVRRPLPGGGLREGFFAATASLSFDRRLQLVVWPIHAH
jgi:Protein of unknown function (DUF3987)